MSVTHDQFVANFPEFADTDAFPAAQFTFWYGVAALVMDAERWGALLDTGAQLYVAHNLVLGAQASQAAAFGGAPGVTTGPIASKAVDKVQAAFDVQSAIEEGGGQFNLTTYGTRWFSLAMMVGSGGMQF